MLILKMIKKIRGKYWLKNYLVEICQLIEIGYNCDILALALSTSSLRSTQAEEKLRCTNIYKPNLCEPILKFFKYM